MVHSIEITHTKLTNIYSETHPQWKYFSSKQVTYDDESLYAQTIPKTMASFFGWKREVGREGTCVYLGLIHVDAWQKPAQYCKALILQLKINVFF